MDAPTPIETVHDASLEGVERECEYDERMKMNLIEEDYEVETGVNK